MKAVETWKPIAGYEGLYEVSDLGRVRSLVDNHGRKRERVLKLSRNKGGYLYIELSKNGKGKKHKVHRLVAFAFVEGYNLFKNQVNHINEDKHDNRAINLEWCDAGYNVNYGTRIERVVKKEINHPTMSIPLIQLTLDYKFVAKWPSTKEVVRQCGFNQGNINSCCLHKPKYKSAHGYRWFYLSEYEQICYKIITSQHPYRLALPYRA